MSRIEYMDCIFSKTSKEDNKTIDIKIENYHKMATFITKDVIFHKDGM